MANMATVEFKTQLLGTQLGYNRNTELKNLDRTYTTLKYCNYSITDSTITKQWMTAEALVKTLNDYADETTDIGKKASAAATEVKTLSQLFDTLKEAAGSGWAKTWEIIVGDSRKQKLCSADLGAVIGGFIDSSADARNTMLQFWKDNGGRESLINSFNAFET